MIHFSEFYFLLCKIALVAPYLVLVKTGRDDINVGTSWSMWNTVSAKSRSFLCPFSFFFLFVCFLGGVTAGFNMHNKCEYILKDQLAWPARAIQWSATMKQSGMCLECGSSRLPIGHTGFPASTHSLALTPFPEVLPAPSSPTRHYFMVKAYK